MLSMFPIYPFIFGQSGKPKNTAELSNQDNQIQAVQTPTVTPLPTIQPTAEQANTIEINANNEESGRIWNILSALGTLGSALISLIVFL